MNRPSQNKTKDGIEKEEQTLISDMAEGQSQDSQIQKVLFNKTGKLISRSTILQITKIHKRTIVNDNYSPQNLHRKLIKMMRRVL